jgi:hypothetical protein
MDDGIDPVLIPLLAPRRHSRDDVLAALRAVDAMDLRQRGRLLDSIEDAPLTPEHRAVLRRVLGPTPAGWR